MEKLSLFDLLSFAIPGGTSIALIYWASVNTFEASIPPFLLPDILFAAVLLMLAYFIGHLMNALGLKLELWFGGVPKSWDEILTENPTLSQKLNEISAEVFDTKFLLEDNTINVTESANFYDNAFYVLEVEEKLEKVRVLQSQYVFFRNSVAVALLGVIVFSWVGFLMRFRLGHWNDSAIWFAFFGAAFCLLSMRLCRKISIERRKMKMAATLRDFYAYYVVEKKVKK